MKGKTFLLLICVLGLFVVTGCGGGGGGEDVPRSSSSYMGSSLPAVLDTTTTTRDLGFNILMEIAQLMNQSGGGPSPAALGSTSSSTSDSGEGGDGGSYTYSSTSSTSWDETSYDASTVQSLTFNDFADSSGVTLYFSEGADPNSLAVSGEPKAFPLRAAVAFFLDDLQAGNGSIYRSSSHNLTTDGIAETVPNSLALAVGPGGNGLVGNPISSGSTYYSNYANYFIGQGYSSPTSVWQNDMLQSGFISAKGNDAYNSTVGNWPFQDTISADYARDYFYSYWDSPSTQNTTQYSQGLMNFNQNHAWDLSTSTLTSSGTICAEGDVPPIVNGCMDFDVSLTWDNDALNGPSYCRGNSDIASCYGWPDDGLITIEAGDATASYAFTPSGATFTFDAGDGSAVFQTNFGP